MSNEESMVLTKSYRRASTMLWITLATIVFLDTLIIIGPSLKRLSEKNDGSVVKILTVEAIEAMNYQQSVRYIAKVRQYLTTVHQTEVERSSYGSGGRYRIWELMKRIDRDIGSRCAYDEISCAVVIYNDALKQIRQNYPLLGV